MANAHDLLMAQRAAMMGGKLPYDEELVCLSSNGNQYIDTLIVPNDSFGFKVSCYVPRDDLYSLNSRVCGVQDGDIRCLFSVHTSFINTFFGWNSAISNLGAYFDTNLIASLNFKNDRSAIINGSVKSSGLGVLGSVTSSAILFGIANNGSPMVSQLFRGKIFSASFSIGINEIDTLKPVLKDGIPCMYGDKSNTFFYNKTSGHQFGYAKVDGTEVAPY